MKGEIHPVGIGIIGCSDVAWRRTLPTMAESTRVRLVCVASRSTEKAEHYADRFSCAAEGDYGSVLRRPEVEAVYLSLPGALHAEWALRALQAGKHVLIEKPMALTFEQTVQLTRLAQDSGLILLENYAFVHHRQHMKAKEFLDSGTIGAIRTFTSAFTIPPRPAGDIRHRADLMGGTLFDTGVYPLRAALDLLGPHLQVRGAALRHDTHRAVMVSGGVLLSTPEGAVCHLTFGMEHSYSAYYEIQGSRGTLTLDRVFTAPPTHHPVIRIRRQDHREEIALAPDDQLATLIGLFCEAVRGRADVGDLNRASVDLASLVHRVGREAAVARG